MQFQITQEEWAKIGKWLLEEVYPPVVEHQLKDPDTAAQLFPDEDGVIRRPYTGAIGGGLTYEFTPTGLGTVTRVTWGKGCGEWEKTLDVTDYDLW